MNETLTRALSGVLYIAILISATLYLNSFLALFGILLMLTVSEFCDLVKLPKRIAFPLALLAYIAFSFFIQNQTIDFIFWIVTFFISIKAMLFLFENKEADLTIASKYLYLIGYIVFPFLLITRLPLIDTIFNPKIIIGLFILIWINDTMAYVVGKSIGKRKLFERISPKKTIEGFLGGLVFAVISSVFIAQYYIFQPIIYWVIIAIIVGVLGTIGDLIESKFKRVAGVKDSGKIMPGHGGILDRLDSIIFAGPFVFLLYQILNYVS
ncbi:phosphatidate cytidylyltransferase [Flavobacterium sp.]|uniref:phosphatidate cytidylyltransferase n=1 Tax=Flavobacterium sp. TaxID=239 RepID=UPI00286AB379|nr:phosphatidate cytidylyltransferase [Flavobacterium sp.]